MQVTLVLCLMLAACWPQYQFTQAINIELNPSPRSGMQLSTFQFYVSDAKLNLNGKSVTVSWRLSDGTQSTAILVTHTTRQLHLIAAEPWQQASHLTLVIGVAPEFNHANPLTLSPPFGDSSMYWTWQRGHKFLRLDGRVSDQPKVFHLGAAGCVGPSGMRPPSEPCSQPNQIELTVNIPNNASTVKLDPWVLLTLPFPPCTFSPMQEQACDEWVRALTEKSWLSIQ